MRQGPEPTPKDGARRLVLAGCGHAHLEVLRGARLFQSRGIEVVLVDPGKFWYSGLGGAVFGGRVEPHEATIDCRALASVCGAEFREDRVVGLDRGSGEAILESGRRIGYGRVSFNIGSRVRVPLAFAGLAMAGTKPLASIPPLQDSVTASDAPVRVAVVGGGASGSEIAGNLLHLGRSRARDIRVTLVTASPRLVPDAPPALGARVLKRLTQGGATVRLSSRVEAADVGCLTFRSGAPIPFDRLILATGLEADPVMAALGLPVRDGGLRIAAALNSIADPNVFAAGDCASIEGYDLPKSGVYGVRAGPVLLRNLLASLEGRPLEIYRPQRHHLSIIDLADGRALATRAGFWTESRLALRLKNHLDRRFLARYRGIYDRG